MRVFESVVTVVFQSIFGLETHQNKKNIIFYINILKRYKIIKKII